MAILRDLFSYSTSQKVMSVPIFLRTTDVVILKLLVCCVNLLQGVVLILLRIIKRLLSEHSFNRVHFAKCLTVKVSGGSFF